MASSSGDELYDIMINTSLLEIEKEYLTKVNNSLSEKSVQLDGQIQYLSAKVADLMENKDANPNFQEIISSRVRGFKIKVDELEDRVRKLLMKANEAIEASIELDSEISEKKKIFKSAVIQIVNEKSEPYKPKQDWQGDEESFRCWYQNQMESNKKFAEARLESWNGLVDDAKYTAMSLGLPIESERTLNLDPSDLDQP